MKNITNIFSKNIISGLRSASFALFLSIGMIAISCNSGTAQNDKGETQEAEETAAAPAAAKAEYQNIDVAKFDKLRENKDYVLLDVRTPKEVAAGKIGDALELDYFGATFADEIGKLDKNKQWLVYCAVGGRSSKAAQQMIDMGFKNVYNLNGGYTSWSAAHPN